MITHDCTAFSAFKRMIKQLVHVPVELAGAPERSLDPALRSYERELDEA